VTNLITPADLQFYRQSFLSGGPDSVKQLVSLQVFARGTGVFSEPVWSFDRMIVHQVAQLDAEHTSFVQSANRTIKLYSFDRAVLMLSLQLIVMDAADRNVDNDGHQGYQHLLWLYENELKISVAALKQRTIVLNMHGMRYYGAVVSMTDGWAADADHMVPVAMEFLVTHAERIKLPEPNDQTRAPVRVTASRELPLPSPGATPRFMQTTETT